MKILRLAVLCLILPSGFSYAQTFGGYPMQLNGVAALIDSGTTLRVAPLGGGVGSAFTINSLPINADTSFATFFKFRIGDGSGADGMVFVVQNDGGGETTTGGGGGGLGFNGIDNSIGVEIDTWTNGEHSDPNNNHMGIDTNGSPTSLITFNPSVDVDSGTPYYVWVDYDGATNNLLVFFSTTSIKPADPEMTQNLDLAAIVGAQGHVGFVGSTGGANNNHDIQEWTLTWSGSGPAVPIPMMSAWALILMALLVLGLSTKYLVQRKH